MVTITEARKTRQEHEWRMEYSRLETKLCQGLVIPITGNVVCPIAFAILPESRTIRNVETDGDGGHSVLRPVSPLRREPHSTIIRSAHSTSDTKIAGLPNFAPHWFKSVSVTPRAREQAPHAKIGICLATTFASVSLSGGQPTGIIEFTIVLRKIAVASANRKICT